MKSLNLIPVAPIGTRKEWVLVDGPGNHQLVEVLEGEYAESAIGQALKKLRLERRVTLRHASVSLEIPAKDLSSLENGRAQLSEDEWELLFAEMGNIPRSPA